MNATAGNEPPKAFAKAEQVLQNTEYDLAGGFTLAAANRAYYTCFYCMTALLYTENTVAKTHQGLRAKSSGLFIKTGIFPPETSDDIGLLLDNRQEANYDLDAEINVDEAKDLIHKATKFFQPYKVLF